MEQLKSPPRIAITGGIACGKSHFSSLLAREGMTILDADEVVHRLEAPGGLATLSIQDAFGSDMILPDGGVDRRRLGQLVFSDPLARSTLNKIVHPLVKDAIKSWFLCPYPDLKAVAVPLLFESGWDREFDVIVCLASDEALQIERMIKTRGYTASEAYLRIHSQMPVAEKASRSHIVVWNNSDLAFLDREARRVYGLLKEKCL